MAYVLDDFEAATRLAQAEAADLERRGETGMRSTMVGLEAWIAALTGDAEQAVSRAEESRRLSAADDAVSQILWRAAMGLAKAETAPEEADRITREATEVAEGTDSTDAGTAWEARARTLSILGRPAEATAAARRARDLYADKGAVNGLRRVEALIVE